MLVNQEGIPIKTTMDSSTTAVYGGLVIIAMSSPKIPIKTTMDSSTTAVYGGLVTITMSSPKILGRAHLYIYCNSLDELQFGY